MPLILDGWSIWSHGDLAHCHGEWMGIPYDGVVIGWGRRGSIQFWSCKTVIWSRHIRGLANDNWDSSTKSDDLGLEWGFCVWNLAGDSGISRSSKVGRKLKEHGECSFLKMALLCMPYIFHIHDVKYCQMYHVCLCIMKPSFTIYATVPHERLNWHRACLPK